MALPEKYTPCPEEWMSIRNNRFTICEVLREIYHYTDNENIKMLSRVAMNMAKRMNNKLMEYNSTWQEVFDGNTHKVLSQIGGELCKK